MGIIDGGFGPLSEEKARLVEELVRQHCLARITYLTAGIASATEAAEAQMAAIYERAVQAGVGAVFLLELGY